MDPNTSAFLLELHRASRRMRHAELRSWVFDELKRIIQFDSAFWYRWAATPDRSHIHASYLYQQPETLLQEYASGELWKEDVVYRRAVDAPRGTAVYASYDDYTSERMRAFLKRHRQLQVLTIAVGQEVAQIASGLSLYRNETRGPFTTTDAAIIEAVAPHIVDAWRENWLREIVRGTSTRAESQEFSLAVLMPDRMLSEAQDNFGPLMHLEFPAWQGPWLPNPVTRHLSRSREPWSGAAITVYQREQPDRTSLLLVRRGHRLDRLAPRKKAVALLFARGASQTEVARALSLSSSTVNNYLGEVYQRLEISDKVELSTLVMQLEP